MAVMLLKEVELVGGPLDSHVEMTRPDAVKVNVVCVWDHKLINCTYVRGEDGRFWWRGTSDPDIEVLGWIEL